MFSPFNHHSKLRIKWFSQENMASWIKYGSFLESIHSHPYTDFSLFLSLFLSTFLQIMSLMSMLLIQGGVHMVTRPHHQHTILNGNVT